MSSQTGTWLIAIGALGACIGIIMLPAALGEHPDTSLLILGACGVSLGSLIAASGIYLKARALQSGGGPVKGATEPKNSARRVRCLPWGLAGDPLQGSSDPSLWELSGAAL